MKVTSPKMAWMTRQDHTRLQSELAALCSQPSIEVPDDLMEYDGKLATYLARRTRIRRIRDLLSNAIIDEQPSDDGIAEPGMVLTVRYDDTGDTETFLLGVPDAEDTDIEVCSVHSPLGSAIVEALTGEQRRYRIPSGANVPVTLLKAVPYGIHVPKSPGRQLVSASQR